MKYIFLIGLVFMLIGCCDLQKCLKKYESVTAIGDYRDKDFKVIREYKEPCSTSSLNSIPQRNSGATQGICTIYKECLIEYCYYDHIGHCIVCNTTAYEK